MLDPTTRSAILRLRKEGHGTRAIAEALGISRGAVKRVLGAGNDDVPHRERAELAERYRTDILALYASCKGNLVRVHEELEAHSCYQFEVALAPRISVSRNASIWRGASTSSSESRCWASAGNWLTALAKPSGMSAETTRGQKMLVNFQGWRAADRVVSSRPGAEATRSRSMPSHTFAVSQDNMVSSR